MKTKNKENGIVNCLVEDSDTTTNEVEVVEEEEEERVGLVECWCFWIEWTTTILHSACDNHMISDHCTGQDLI